MRTIAFSELCRAVALEALYQGGAGTVFTDRSRAAFYRGGARAAGRVRTRLYELEARVERTHG